MLGQGPNPNKYVKDDAISMFVQLLQVQEISRQMVTCVFDRQRLPGLNTALFHDIRRTLCEK